MRPVLHKAFSVSRLGINYFLRKFFWFIFLLCLGFIIGLFAGLYKNIINDIHKKDITSAVAIGIIFTLSFILWLFFMGAHRRRRKKEELHSIIEYLEELRDNGALSMEDFLKEKDKFTNQYL